jgi:hypothetical protein
MYQRFKQAATPQDVSRYLSALGAFSEPALIERTLSVYRSDEVRVQDGPFAIAGLLDNRHAAVRAWDMVERDWDAIVAKYPPFTIGALLRPLIMTVEDPLGDRMARWFQDHPIPEVERQLQQALEFQGINRAFAARVRGHLRSALEGRREG